MPDNSVLIQIRGDVADINAKLADLKGYIGKVKDETKNLAEQGKTSWQMMAAGIASTVYIVKEAIDTIRKLTDFALSCAQAFGENEQAVLRLTGVLAAHGIASQGVVKAYADMASEFQRTSKYSDEQIMSAQEVLTNWGVMPSKMKEAIETTMALAIRTGDLGSAAEILGKAFDGDTRSLGKLLPGIKGLEKGSLSAGDAMQKVREAIGDTAQKEAEGYISKVKGLKNAWDDFKETLGQYVVPVLKEVIKESINGIHALERLFGVNTLAWKKKELELVEENIKSFRDVSGMGDWSDFMEATVQQPAQRESDLYALNMQKYKLQAEIAEEEKKNEEALKGADKDFKKTPSAAGPSAAEIAKATAAKAAEEAEAARIRSIELMAEYDADLTNAEFKDYQENIKAKEKLDKEQAERAKALREGEIQARLAGLDLAEKEGTAHRETLTERIRLLTELKNMQETDLAAMDKQKDPAAWYAQADAINATRTKLAELEAAQRPVFEALRRYADEATDTWKNVAGAVESAFKGMEDALTEFVMTGKLSFTDLANSIISDLVRIQIQQSVTGPLASALSAGIASLFADSGADWAGTLFHKGGMGNEPTSYRIVPNIDLLPRYHKGLGPGERLSITTDDEMTLTPGQQKAVWKLARESGSASPKESGGDTYNNITITANDSKSFGDMVERNPGSIQVVIQKLLKNNSSLRQTLKRTVV